MLLSGLPSCTLRCGGRQGSSPLRCSLRSALTTLPDQESVCETSTPPSVGAQPAGHIPKPDGLAVELSRESARAIWRAIFYSPLPCDSLPDNLGANLFSLSPDCEKGPGFPAQFRSGAGSVNHPGLIGPVRGMPPDMAPMGGVLFERQLKSLPELRAGEEKSEARCRAGARARRSPHSCLACRRGSYPPPRPNHS